MSTLRGYPIPNLINGVSQQAPQQRRDSQCESQENCFNSPVFGNTARPGTAHVGWLPGEDFSDAKQFDVIRTATEQYRVVIDQNDIRVFDLLTGNEGSVQVEGVSTQPVTVLSRTSDGTSAFNLHHDPDDITTVDWSLDVGVVSEWTVYVRGRNDPGDSWTLLKTVKHDDSVPDLEFSTAIYAQYQVELDDYVPATAPTSTQPVDPVPIILKLVTPGFEDHVIWDSEDLTITDEIVPCPQLSSYANSKLVIDVGPNAEWDVKVEYGASDSGPWSTLFEYDETDPTEFDTLSALSGQTHLRLNIANIVGGSVTVNPDALNNTVTAAVSYTGQAALDETLEYLTSAAPSRRALNVLTIEDTTYIANREVQVQMLPAPTVAPYYIPEDPTQEVYEAFIHFKAGEYLATYTVFVNDRRFYFSTRDGSAASHIADVGTERMARTMAALMTGGTKATAHSGHTVGPAYNLAADGFEVTKSGNLIRLRRTKANGGDFTITGHDNANGDKMLCIKEQVQRFAQLPNICFNGTILRVRGGAGEGASPSDYYVEFEGNGFEGTWRETFKPGATKFINRYTMPHRLISLGSNTFRFETVDWASRVAGDGEETSKDPGFVGKYIEDITLWRDRMGLLHEAGCVLSKTSRFVSFFPTSAQTALDDDPIDFRVANPKIAVLRHAVAHAEQLFLWAPGVQFGIEAQEALTQSTIEIEPTTDFSYDPDAGRPIGSGDNIVFVDNVGPWVAVREQFATVQGIGKDYSEVSAHVPAYVPGPLRWFACDDSLKCYVFAPVGEPNTLYVYQYLVIGDEKQQSAWQRWVFPAKHTVLHGHFWNGRLRLSIQRPDGVVFETLDLSAAQTDLDAHYLTRLDRRVSELDCTWEYTPPLLDDEAGITHITMPYKIHADEEDRVVVITREGGSLAGGEEYEVEEVVAAVDPDYSIVRVRGEIPIDVDFWVGLRLGLRGATYLFSPFIPKDDKGPFVLERVQVRAILVTLANTGWSEAIVRMEDGRTYRYEFTGRVMGSPTNLLGQVAIAKAAIFRIPIKAESSRFTLELVNDSPLPSSWQSAEIQYRATTRAVRSG